MTTEGPWLRFFSGQATRYVSPDGWGVGHNGGPDWFVYRPDASLASTDHYAELDDAMEHARNLHAEEPR